MHSLKKFERFNPNTPQYEEKGRCFCSEHLRIGYLP
ncbi:hypothetical protein Goshw_026163 [Gossypium schwendimanii]|uniref:Uncharacterized protein n=1 Tax=Gossypium schwendimanii TaxID=34291 RepID=A0A7J9NDJ2_GOSSC|nr:hypothetical protein [Gossypium schwendimanii]